MDVAIPSSEIPWLGGGMFWAVDVDEDDDCWQTNTAGAAADIKGFQPPGAGAAVVADDAAVASS